ncbi:hypothetical protein ON010_g17627 [Phytophthora cinnamomi]|nr:hypothetical protein ON010_g17627 [Phytophthora cinnamomi]
MRFSSARDKILTIARQQQQSTAQEVNVVVAIAPDAASAAAEQRREPAGRLPRGNLGRRAALSRVLCDRHSAAREVSVASAYVPIPAEQEVHRVVTLGRLRGQAAARPRLLHDVHIAQLPAGTSATGIAAVVFIDLNYFAVGSSSKTRSSTRSWTSSGTSWSARERKAWSGARPRPPRTQARAATAA